MIRRLLVVLVGIVVAVLGVPAVASAHTELHESSPADGAEVDALPATITLTFGEDLQGPTAPVGVLVDGHDPIQLDAPVEGPTVTIDTAGAELAAVAGSDGKWAIAYTVVGQDGHAIDGTVTFNVAGSGADDGRGDSADDNTEIDTASSSEAAEDEPMSPLLWLAIVAVIGLVVFAVVKTERLRRKKAEAAEGTDSPKA